jgi:DNA-binding CsgD family transcriptional regulator
MSKTCAPELVAEAVRLSMVEPEASMKLVAALLARADLPATLRCEALMARAAAEFQVAQPEQSLRSLEAALALADADSGAERQARCTGRMGLVLIALGRLEEAVARLSAVFARVGQHSGVARAAMLNLAVVAEQCMDVPLAEEFARLALAGDGATPVRGMARLNLAVAQAAQGQFAQAEASAALAVHEMSHANPTELLRARALLAWLEGLQGHVEAGERALRAVIAEAECAGVLMPAVWARRLLVEVLVKAGKHREAVALARRSLDEAVVARAWPRLRELHLWLARAHHLCGEHAESVASFERYAAEVRIAHADAQMPHVRRQLHTLLAALQDRGVAACRPTAEYVIAHDTMRALGMRLEEAHVVRELCQGKSNKAIAQTLGLSQNTVRNQLARAMRIVGSGNRTETASRALQLGLIERMRGDAQA